MSEPTLHEVYLHDLPTPSEDTGEHRIGHRRARLEATTITGEHYGYRAVCLCGWATAWTRDPDFSEAEVSRHADVVSADPATC